MKKLWLVVLAAVAVLAVGAVVGGVALAQEGGASGAPAVKRFASRVAAILGLEEAQVQKAMDQAHREMKDEAVQKRLDALVEEGKLTQEQADAYLQWFKSRPEGVRGLGGPGFGFGGHGHHRFGHGPMGLREWHGAPPAISQGSSGAAGAPAQ